jgi:putative glutamine amidotransferase
MSRPLVAVTADVKPMDGYRWHAAVSIYLDALTEVAQVTPVIVPSLGEALDLASLLSRVDGVVATGSRSNVHPTLYGAQESERAEPYDSARDATTLPLIRAAIAQGVPLLAICRGFQELNVALGGTLDIEIQEMPGRMDHRGGPSNAPQDERFAPRHPVLIQAEGNCLGRILGAEEIAVNSVHRQAVGRLSDRLQVEATAPDGTIEAASVRGAKGFTLGMQWHPEYWARSDDPSRRIFEAFGDAARAHTARRERAVAAE